MHPKINLALLVGCLSAAGCASNSSSLVLVEPESKGATSRIVDSQTTHLVSSRVVTARFGRRVNELPCIAVVVTNRGDQPVNFSTANVEAFADGRPVKIYTPYEYALLVQGAARAENTAIQAREQNARVRSSWGAGPTSTFAITGQINAVTERSELRQKHLKWLRNINEMLSASAVAPGQTHGGVIRLEAAPLLIAQRVRLQVTVGSETHELHFSVKSSNKTMPTAEVL